GEGRAGAGRGRGCGGRGRACEGARARRRRALSARSTAGTYLDGGTPGTARLSIWIGVPGRIVATRRCANSPILTAQGEPTLYGNADFPRNKMTQSQTARSAAYRHERKGLPSPLIRTGPPAKM